MPYHCAYIASHSIFPGHISASHRLALLTFNEVGPQFSNQDSRLGPVNEMAKKLSTLHHPRSISVTSAI